MNPFCKTIIIVVFLLFCANGLQAQTTQTKLDQIELGKQFLGTWKAEIAKDTFKVYTEKPFGTGAEGNIKIVTKGKTVQEGRIMFGYDKKSDRFLQSIMMHGSDISLQAFWFTSKNTGELVQLKDIANPENATLKSKFEIKSPDLWEVTAIENNKTIGTLTYTRVKK